MKTKIFNNVISLVALTFLLSVIGILLTRAIYCDGGLFMCCISILLVCIIESINMLDVTSEPLPANIVEGTNAVANKQENLAFTTLFMWASLVSHFVCAFFFFSYLHNLGVISEMPWNICAFWATMPNGIGIIMGCLLYRVIIHIIFIATLIHRKNYFIL